MAVKRLDRHHDDDDDGFNNSAGLLEKLSIRWVIQIRNFGQDVDRQIEPNK